MRHGGRDGDRRPACARRPPGRARSGHACRGPRAGQRPPRRGTRPSCARCWSAGSRRRSTRSGVSKRKCASMISKPLFIIVAESIVTFGPMFQVGWASASAGVIDPNVSSGRRRKGPPLAVNTNRDTDAGSSPRRHCQSAECSLSMGMMRAPDAAARALTISPAMTRTSFVAVATVRPASIAASVGRIAAAPVIATQTTSASIAAISQAASIPLAHPEGSPADASGYTRAVRATLNRVATASRAAASRPATAPTSSKRSGNLAMTSHA